MIGMFFNTFMPGAVGGDLIKAWYIAGEEPQRKTRAVFTVLLDRIIGLIIFFLYSATTLLFYLDWLNGKPQLQLIAYTVWTVTGLSLIGGLIFYSPLWTSRLFERTLAFLQRVRFLGSVIEACVLYRHHLTTIFFAVIMSALSISSLTFFYYLQGSNLNIPLDMAHYFFIVPIALTASAVPILPGGLGVGQVAFFTLFQWSGVPNPELGGNALHRGPVLHHYF